MIKDDKKFEIDEKDIKELNNICDECKKKE